MIGLINLEDDREEADEEYRDTQQRQTAFEQRSVADTTEILRGPIQYLDDKG